MAFLRVYGYALVCVLTLSLSATAEDKKEGLTGLWNLSGAQMKLEFVDKEVLKIYPHGDSDVLAIICKYTADKDAQVKAKITDLEGKVKDKAKDKIPVGQEFSFKWQVKDAKSTLSDVKGDNVDIFKAHMEGEYDKK